MARKRGETFTRHTDKCGCQKCNPWTSAKKTKKGREAGLCGRCQRPHQEAGSFCYNCMELLRDNPLAVGVHPSGCDCHRCYCPPPSVCTHEAWEDSGSSRRCADCQEYLGQAPETPPPYADVPPPPALPPPFRHRMPAERTGVTHKFDIAGCEGYLTVGLFPDGTPGEIFLRMAKQGSTIGGFADAWATCFSMALQYGVPLERMCNKFTAWSFEPSGFTGNDDVPNAKSVIDYVSRWLMVKYGPKSGGGM